MKTVIALAALLMVGCTEQERARNWGGAARVELRPGEKLVQATWKQDDLWLLVRAMHPGETAETYGFKESSSWGVMEGTVVIVEHAK